MTETGKDWGYPKMMSIPQIRANLRRWRDELRSTTRQQGTGLLKQHKDGIPRYCCLGVWCELREQDGDVVSRVEPTGSATRFAKGIHAHDSAAYRAGTLPLGLSEELGSYFHGDVLILNVPRLMDRHGDLIHLRATTANDLHNLTFPQIADCLTWEYQLDTPDE